MKQLISYILVGAFFFGSTVSVLAQNLLPDSLRFTIRKDYRPVARDAKKILSRPEVKHNTTELPKIEYSVIPKVKEVSYEAEPLKAAKLSNEPLAKLYNGFAKVGFGNYTMPFFEGSFCIWVLFW